MNLKPVTIRTITTATITTISCTSRNRRLGHRKFNADVRNGMATIDTIRVRTLSPARVRSSRVSFVCLDVRQEAVKQALEQFGARPIPSSKRLHHHHPATAHRELSRKQTNLWVTAVLLSISDASSEEDEDDDGDESSSTYGTTTDDQHTKETSVSPAPMPTHQQHHYQNPPTVESIIRSTSIGFSRRLFHYMFFFFRYSGPLAATTTAVHVPLRFHSSQSGADT